MTDINVAADMSPSYFVIQSRSETTIDFYLFQLVNFVMPHIKYSFKREDSKINALSAY